MFDAPTGVVDLPFESRPVVLVVMGATGSGKTTLAEGLAERLAWRFQEGDALHSKANIKKMASGQPLSDADRTPWLKRIKHWIDAQLAANVSGVITCSALKKRYRRQIGVGRPRVALVYLKADGALLADRMALRQGHFMPPALLDSQLEDLEPPSDDEGPIAILAQTPLTAQIERVIKALSAFYSANDAGEGGG